MRATSWSIEDSDTAQCSLIGLRQLSASSLLIWPLGNEESCIPSLGQLERPDNVQPSGDAAVGLESPHAHVRMR